MLLTYRNKQELFWKVCFQMVYLIIFIKSLPKKVMPFKSCLRVFCEIEKNSFAKCYLHKKFRLQLQHNQSRIFNAALCLNVDVVTLEIIQQYK